MLKSSLLDYKSPCTRNQYNILVFSVVRYKFFKT